MSCGLANKSPSSSDANESELDSAPSWSMALTHRERCPDPPALRPQHKLQPPVLAGNGSRFALRPEPTAHL
eukprot:3159959-Rhodomonas_salina.1